MLPFVQCFLGIMAYLFFQEFHQFATQLGSKHVHEEAYPAQAYKEKGASNFQIRTSKDASLKTLGGGAETKLPQYRPTDSKTSLFHWNEAPLKTPRGSAKPELLPKKPTDIKSSPALVHLMKCVSKKALGTLGGLMRYYAHYSHYKYSLFRMNDAPKATQDAKIQAPEKEVPYSPTIVQEDTHTIPITFQRRLEDAGSSYYLYVFCLAILLPLFRYYKELYKWQKRQGLCSIYPF